MNILICGLKGTGKTTLAKKIAKDFDFNYISDFEICAGGSIVERTILDFIESHSGFVLDLCYSVSPESCSKLKNVCCLYLGFSRIDELVLQQKMNEHGESVSLDDVRLLKSKSAKMKQKCEKYGVIFIDVNKNRDEIMQNAYKIIEEKIRT